MSRQPQATAPASLADANLFDITGPIAVGYSRSSIAGVPLLSYRDTEQDLNFQGAEITRVDTALGELVTVTLEDIPDAFVRTFTLVVPTVRLVMGEQIEFDTLSVETTDRSGAFVPAPGPAGVLRTYRLHQLHGTAQAVNF